MPSPEPIEAENPSPLALPGMPSASEEAHPWQPIDQTQRFVALDVIRGIALLGVLLVNLLSDFRIPLAQHILTFHTDPDWTDRAVDIGVAVLLEFKAMTLFSLLFGVGVAVFAERAAARGVDATRFLARRFLVLLALGLCHLLLIWNGDILTLYAVCGVLLLPLLRLRTPTLACVGILLLGVAFVNPLGFLWPGDAVMHSLATEGARIYARGSFADVLGFHWRETGQFIVPILFITLPKIGGLMALGAAAWRAGVVRDPQKHQELLREVALLGSVLGGTMTILSVHAASTGTPSNVPSLALEAGSMVPLSLAYGAGLLLALRSPRLLAAAAPFAAVGRMAMTNYLTQSVALSLLFYGYGLGLAGRTGSATAALIGVVLYAIQMLLSCWWLRRYRFGPVEWLWRSLTYGRRQSMQRTTKPSPPQSADG